MSSKQEYRVNERIRSERVRLVDENGENAGIVGIDVAQRRADDAGLDLVEISPNSDPPVCKIVNYKKFLYEKERKEREARKSQTVIKIKEIRMRPRTAEADRGHKVNDARGFLEDGMKVKITVRFRGREITYPELALQDLREIAQELSDIAEVEQAPNMDGKSMCMLLTPKKA